MRMMKTMLLSLTLVWAGSAMAEPSLDFRQAYELASRSDPEWLAARARERAEAQELALGRSRLLPTLSYRYNRGRNNTHARQESLIGPVYSRYNYDSYSSGFTLSQPLFDAAAYAQYRVGDERAEAAGLTLERARQALAVRVLQAYTDVLFAQQALSLAEAQVRSLHEDARRSARFVAAGEGTRTDELEIEARSRVVEAQAIEARDALRDARNGLAMVIGPDLGERPLAPLQLAGFSVLGEDGLALPDWRNQALSGNPELRAQRHLLEASRQRYNAARAGHLPTARLYARKQITDSSAENQIGQRYDTGSIGIEITIPIYSGGQTSAASSQALAEQEEAQHKLDGATRALLDDLERQYHTYASSRLRIDAYARAAQAATERVKATRRSVLAGERTNLDVLDAERQQFETERDLARARYDYLLAWMALRWQAGVLQDEDVRRMSTLFAGPPEKRLPQAKVVQGQLLADWPGGLKVAARAR